MQDGVRDTVSVTKADDRGYRERGEGRGKPPPHEHRPRMPQFSSSSFLIQQCLYNASPLPRPGCFLRLSHLSVWVLGRCEPGGRCPGQAVLFCSVLFPYLLPNCLLPSGGQVGGGDMASQADSADPPLPRDPEHAFRLFDT